MNPEDCVITVTSDVDSYYSYGSDTYNVDTNGITLSDITLTEPDPDLHVEGDIISRKGGETINVTEIIHDQKLQIESLSDMIKEMVETKNFNIEWDLQKRVDQKKFLNKLGEDPNDL